MTDIRPFIENHLLEPLKHYPTIIQHTMIEIIIQKLQALYDYMIMFPEIVSPNKSRLDILQAIADQFLFTVREDADIQEQVDILDHILYIYNRRGSIDTIENMWEYYGGTLPKEVKVIIPSYNLFRYSISALSGTHVFQDNTINRTGVYEIRLTNNTYPIPDLREFLIKELVCAGNYFYFTNALHMDILSNLPETNPYKYDITVEDTFVELQMEVLKVQQGFTWSGYNTMSRRSEDSAWSGRGSIFLEVLRMIDLPMFYLNTYHIYKGIDITKVPYTDNVVYEIINDYKYTEVEIDLFLYCTPTSSSLIFERNSYNRNGELITSRYPGYFIIGETPLDSEIETIIVTS